MYGFKLLKQPYKMFLYKNLAITEVWDQIKSSELPCCNVNKLYSCLYKFGCHIYFALNWKAISLVSRVCSLLQETKFLDLNPSTKKIHPNGPYEWL